MHIPRYPTDDASANEAIARVDALDRSTLIRVAMLTRADDCSDTPDDILREAIREDLLDGSIGPASLNA